MRVVKGSRILRGTEAVLAKMEQTLSKSQIVSFLQTGYWRVESTVCFSGNAGLQRFIMRATEKSLLLARLRGFWTALASTSVSSFGVCLLLYALGSMVFAYGASPLDWQSEWLWLLFVLLVSAPMLAVRQSLGYTVRHSRFLGGFFFGFCGLRCCEYSCKFLHKSQTSHRRFIASIFSASETSV